MVHDTLALKSRAAFTSASLALASVGIALSTLFTASVAAKVELLVIAASVLVATGTVHAMAMAIARATPPRAE